MNAELQSISYIYDLSLFVYSLLISVTHSSHRKNSIRALGGGFYQLLLKKFSIPSPLSSPAPSSLVPQQQIHQQQQV